MFRDEILEEANRFFFEEHQSVNEDENITSMSMSQWMLILLVKFYKLAIFLITFTLELSSAKIKLLLVTAMENYNKLIITFKILFKTLTITTPIRMTA